jgi:hypothetical protein
VFDAGIEKVELWVDGANTNITDDTEPYEVLWNTTTYNDGSVHIIVVRAYDINGNTADTPPLPLTVDNSGSYPQSVNITSITYTLTDMTITWTISTESDFDHYELLVSESEDGDKTPIVEVSEINDNIYVLTEFDPSQPRWYWISVFDVYGLSTVSNGYYVIDDNPTQVELYPITYQDGSFYITWSQNQDEDFQSYSLYESFSEDMSGASLINEITVITDTTYVVTGIGAGEIRYYQVVTNTCQTQVVSVITVISLIKDAPLISSENDSYKL